LGDWTVYIKKMFNRKLGDIVVENLSSYLQDKEPDIKGFSAQNLWRMRQFYETYYNNEKLSPLVREISWTNNMLIISQTKSNNFYLTFSKGQTASDEFKLLGRIIKK